MKLLISCGVTALLLATSTSALAQSAQGSGSVTVLRPLTVSNNANLAFGTVVRPETGSGSVGVSTAGAATYTNVTAVSSGGAPAPAQFTIAGEGGQLVSVSVPATFIISSNGNDLTVTTTTDVDGNQPLSGALGGDGSKVVKVGGSVPIASTTPSGAYSGAFTVSANYN